MSPGKEGGDFPILFLLPVIFSPFVLLVYPAFLLSLIGSFF